MITNFWGQIFASWSTDSPYFPFELSISRFESCNQRSQKFQKIIFHHFRWHLNNTFEVKRPGSDDLSFHWSVLLQTSIRIHVVEHEEKISKLKTVPFILHVLISLILRWLIKFHFKHLKWFIYCGNSSPIKMETSQLGESWT